jgi:molybdopterin biosynthesis enzyme MoaB
MVAFRKQGYHQMKSFIVLAGIAVLTLGNAIAAMPGAAGSVRTMAAAQPFITMAEQELPFDRYWSKN